MATNTKWVREFVGFAGADQWGALAGNEQHIGEQVGIGTLNDVIVRTMLDLTLTVNVLDAVWNGAFVEPWTSLVPLIATGVMSLDNLVWPGPLDLNQGEARRVTGTAQMLPYGVTRNSNNDGWLATYKMAKEIDSHARRKSPDGTGIPASAATLLIQRDPGYVYPGSGTQVYWFGYFRTLFDAP